MGATPAPTEPAPIRSGTTAPTLQEVARVILADRRLTHRYCMIASGWRPEGTPTPQVDDVAHARQRLELLAADDAAPAG